MPNIKNTGEVVATPCFYGVQGLAEGCELAEELPILLFWCF